MRYLCIAALLGIGVAGCAPTSHAVYEASPEFSDHVAEARAAAFAAAARHPHHEWRDTVPVTAQDLLQGYIEIGFGDRDKREFSIEKNALVVDRVLDERDPGYPVNYGFVPRTLAYDGDPLDVLVLGPRIEPGEWVQGVILGVMHMLDEKGADPKIVISRVNRSGEPLHALTLADKERLGAWFDAYKKRDRNKWSRVTSWGDVEDARRTLQATRDYFDAGNPKKK